MPTPFSPISIWRGMIPPTFVLSDSKAKAFYDFVQSRKGYVYIMQPPTSDLYKVGRTSKNPFVREKTLTTAGVIGEYRLKWCAEFANSSWAEAAIHTNLSTYHDTKEFFKAPLDVLKETLEQQVKIEDNLLKDLQKELLLTQSYEYWIATIDVNTLILEDI